MLKDLSMEAKADGGFHQAATSSRIWVSLGSHPFKARNPFYARCAPPCSSLSTLQRQRRSNKNARNEDDAPYCSLICERARAVRPLPHKPHRSRCTDIQPWRRLITNQCHVFLATLFQLLQGRRKNPVIAMTTFRLPSEKFPNDMI